MTELRRPSAGRFSGALWGILIAACGALMIASFSGFSVDFQLLAILTLCALGLWLLLTALFSSGAKSRSAQRTAAEAREGSPSDEGEQAADASPSDVTRN